VVISASSETRETTGEKTSPSEGNTPNLL